MLIRPATIRDARAIARVQVRAWHMAYRGIIPDAYLAGFTLEHRTNRWLTNLAELRRMETAVAEDDDAIVGWAGFGANESDLGPEVAELGGLYVDPAHWDRGTGACLLSYAEKELAAGFGEAILWTLEENTRSRRFYENRGWRFDGARDRHRSGAAVVRYRKTLSLVDPTTASA